MTYLVHFRKSGSIVDVVDEEKTIRKAQAYNISYPDYTSEIVTFLCPLHGHGSAEEWLTKRVAQYAEAMWMAKVKDSLSVINGDEPDTL